MKFVTKNIDDIDFISEKLIEQFKHKVVLFYGEMGNGKTTLIKQLCKKLGVSESTSSPTFSIVNEYKTDKNNTIYQFDFYRIKKIAEVLDFGIEEYFDSTSPCLMEWPELIEPLLPPETLRLTVTVMADGSRVIENRP